ncbi:ribulose bisphosphate carboxylase small subunit, chloroplastic [Elaeis guineensis]|uniref:Ribulose bisphosphate carboxylase small subunit, chloroplastic n=1 Tax=Elaeis guineensis var. tenera TaxID=51953 RepID=A0A6I9QSB0_ELAGV|nr:ribulose bisphosphate carboxylase small chain clone 512 [Elaeis guineensis]
MSSLFLSAVPVAGSACIGLRSDASGRLFPETGSVQWRARTVSNGSRVHCMKTWNPINNKKFEALSYLPSLSEESVAKEVEYMLSKGWIPGLEFDEVGEVHRTNSRIPGYYDGRYWTLWKLPMFGCTDSAQVLQEIDECKKTYPNAYIRLLAFNSKRQCQCMSFVIQKPSATSANA